MIIMIKKWNLLLLACIGAVVVGTCGYAAQLRPAISASALPIYGRRVVVDAGHGAPDGGAVGQSGVQEKDINLAIAFKVQEFLEQSGAQVVVTRADDNSIHNTGHNIRSKKISDMKNRKKIMNESDADVFLSIHMNEFEQSKYRGHQVFYARNGEPSKQLAQLIQARLIEVLNPPEQREIKPADSGIYLLKNAEIPAVLVECGFVSNPEEERLLLDADYQKKIAWGIYTGLSEWFHAASGAAAASAALTQ